MHGWNLFHWIFLQCRGSCSGWKFCRVKIFSCTVFGRDSLNVCLILSFLGRRRICWRSWRRGTERLHCTYDYAFYHKWASLFIACLFIFRVQQVSEVHRVLEEQKDQKEIRGSGEERDPSDYQVQRSEMHNIVLLTQHSETHTISNLPS